MFRQTITTDGVSVSLLNYNPHENYDAIIKNLIKDSCKFKWLNREEILNDMKRMLKEGHGFTDDELFESFLIGMGMPINENILDITYSFCIKCGKCCRESFPIHFSEQELFKIARVIHKTKHQMKNDGIVKYDNSIKMYYFANSPCPLLKGNLCSHYNVRPNACKIFPIFNTQYGKQCLYQPESRCEITYVKALYSGLGFLIGKKLQEK